MSKNKENKKKNKAFDIISMLIIIVCAIVFVVSAAKLIAIYSEYHAASSEYAQLSALIPHVNRENETVERGSYETPDEEDVEEETEEIKEQEIVPAPVFMEDVDWEALYNNMHDLNNDYEGWLYISNTKISYPIVQGEDNDFYLHHTFFKEDVFSGCLYIDCSVENGIEGKNVIVYGHNMKDGSMFAGLKKFREAGFRKRHPSFAVYTSTGAYEYQIFASYVTSPESYTYITSFPDENAFMDYINTVKSWSEVNYGVEVYPGDQIITLSTCVNNNVDRLVIQAKRVQ